MPPTKTTALPPLDFGDGGSKRGSAPVADLPDLDFGDGAGRISPTAYKDVGSINPTELPPLNFTPSGGEDRRTAVSPSLTALPPPPAPAVEGSLAPEAASLLPELDFGTDLPPEPSPADLWQGRPLRTPVAELEGGQEFVDLISKQLSGEKRGFKEAISDVDSGTIPFCW